MCNMKEQEKRAWADLKKLVVEYSDACKGKKGNSDVLLNKLNAALDLYYNNNMIKASVKDITDLKVGFCGIKKYPDAFVDVMNIIKRLSGEKNIESEYVMQGVVEKVFGGR